MDWSVSNDSKDCLGCLFFCPADNPSIDDAHIGKEDEGFSAGIDETQAGELFAKM